MEGQKVKWTNSPRYSMNLGIVLAPEDRKQQGLVLDQSCQVNINMVDFKSIQKWGLYDSKSANDKATELGNRFGLNRPIDTLCRNLSGGNQQKAVLARGRLRPAKVHLFDEPTVGIDVGAKADVYRLIDNYADAGHGVVVISSDLTEIIGISDRVYVMREGRIAAHLAGTDITEENIARSFFAAAPA